MFFKGDIVEDGDGQLYEIMVHWVDGQFPVLARSTKTGILEKFTHEGRYFAHRESERDLRPIQPKR